MRILCGKLVNFHLSQIRLASSNIFSKTLNLPSSKINLSMKNIYENEKNIQKDCKNDELYKWQEKTRQNAPVFTLHDGPPYANGDLHMGHLVNKVLKDVHLRYKLLRGYRVNYIPGWDCHGLPIELNATKKLKENHLKDNALLVRKISNDFAEKYIQLQMNTFKELGLLADWNHIYKTKDPQYMCSQIDLFHKLYKNGLIFRSFKPVYWSVASKTALAEFEIEYNTKHKSESCFVAFDINELNEDITKILKPHHQLKALIWTTTPWSLPGNKAIAFNKHVEYELICVKKNDVYVLAKDLTDEVAQKVPLFQNSPIERIATLSGDKLQGLKYKNPFLLGNQSLLFSSDHVTTKQGTGLVHIAPSFGHDDFKIGLKYGLKTTCAIDEDGKYDKNDETLTTLGLSGKNAFDEESISIIKSIVKHGLLFSHEYIHSYPYDWRTKTPLITRSSQQWFIDTNKLKQRALDALENVKIYPGNTTNAMISTLNSRPYWCISRQRVWGLPIPCLFDEKNEPLITDEFVSEFKNLIQKDGNVDFWWSDKYDRQLIGDKNLIKSKDILDIWFDSGSSFNSVLNGMQADMYCEGHDQFSGWFQGSLLLSVALHARAPYKTINVHGFVVDENNRKMSKSIGNIIEPKQALKGDAKIKIPQCGNDVLRFWTVHEAHKPYIQIGTNVLESMLQRVYELRNVIKFLIANTNDFNFNNKDNLIDYESLLAIDKYALCCLNNFVNGSIQNYDEMSIHKNIILIENFLNNDVSSMYIKSIKDRLYCESNDSYLRRSAQTVLASILHKSLIVLAPILPNLCEYAYKNSCLHIQNNNEITSIFQSKLDFSLPEKWNNCEINRLFEALKQIKNEFNFLTKSDNIALFDVKLKCSKNFLNTLNKENSNLWLNDYLGCSSIELVEMTLNNREFQMEAKKNTKKQPCMRCRKYVKEETEYVCDRCQNILRQVSLVAS